MDTKHKFQNQTSNTQVEIAHLPLSFGEEQLAEMMSAFPGSASCRVLRGADGRSTGEGRAVVKGRDAARHAAREVDGTKIFGRRLVAKLGAIWPPAVVALPSPPAAAAAAKAGEEAPAAAPEPPEPNGREAAPAATAEAIKAEAPAVEAEAPAVEAEAPAAAKQEQQAPGGTQGPDAPAATEAPPVEVAAAGGAA
jgi:hypothetical protein